MVTAFEGGISDVAIARWRLRNQRLVAPFAGSAHAVIRSLLGVQAENPGQAAWAVAARTQRRDPSDLTALLDDGVVLRTHVLRPTWHFVCADDIAWLAGLTGPRVQRVTGQQLRAVHGLDDTAIDRAMSVIVEAIGERGELTRPSLGEELTARGVSGAPPAGGQFLMILLAHAELAGLVCSGRPVRGEHTYALLADRARPRGGSIATKPWANSLCGTRSATDLPPNVTSPTGRASPSVTPAGASGWCRTGWNASTTTAGPTGTRPAKGRRLIRPRCSHEGICCRSSTSATAATKTPAGCSTPPA
jgi:DNA glycosylase AlkZ-like